MIGRITPYEITLGFMRARPHNRFSVATALAIDPQSLRRDLYLLLACALSSKRFAEQTSGNDYDTLQKLRDSLEQREVAALLLAVSVRVRLLDDRGELSKSSMNIQCGSLLSGTAHGGRKKPLSLREACNKIVHCRRVQLRVSYLDGFDSTLPSPTSDHMEPFLLLHGTRDRKAWRASLDLVKFCRAILSTGLLYET